MQYVSKRCPHCNALIGSHKGTRLGVGVPIKKCLNCGTPYIDSELKEWESMKESEKIFYLTIKEKKRFAYPLFMAIFFMVLALGLSTAVLVGTSDFEWTLLIPVALLLIVFFLPGLLGLLNYLKSKKKLTGFISDKEIVESVIRTSEPDYRELLIKGNVRFYPLKREQYAIDEINTENKQFEDSKPKLDEIYEALKLKYGRDSKPIIDELTNLLKNNEITSSQHQYIINKLFADILSK